MPVSPKAGVVLVGAGVLLIVLWFITVFKGGKLIIDRPHPMNESEPKKGCCDSKFSSWKEEQVTRLLPPISKDCKKIFNGSDLETSSVLSKKKMWKNQVSDTDVLKATSNCTWVKDNFNNNLYTTKLELSFPIAFVFVIYNSPQQVMRLLKLLYRPHNQYCISPDNTSAPVFIGIFKNLAKCLDNIHIASTLRNVEWGHPSIMEAEMCCYQDLMKIRERQADKDKWMYAINLCGKELPLATNHEIVSRLVQLNGSSMLEAELVKGSDQESLRRTYMKKPVPYSIPYAKSSAYKSLSYKFIDFILTNSTAIDVYKFFQKSWIPEEHYFATMYMLPNVPGGMNLNLPKNRVFITSRYCWTYNRREKRDKNCHGKVVHNICIVEAGDLTWLLKKPSHGELALFQNKYFMENDHVIMDCMEERIIASNKLEYEKECRRPCG